MNLLRRFRRSLASPAPDPVTRRRFFAGAGVGAAALLGADAQAAPLDIEPGTLVDAQGRPFGREARGFDPYIGEIMLVGWNFAARGWALCQGQLLPISQHTALFSLLGTIYGGDGRTTFALPDLQGRMPMGFGNGPGLTSRQLGQKSGTETNTLNSTQLPSHVHSLPHVQVRGTGTQVIGATTGGDLGTTTPTGTAGNNQPVNNMPPYVVLNYQIALQGIFPSRN